MLPYRPANTQRPDDFRVRQADRPGWVSGTTRVPRAGEDVFCAGGAGTVTAVHGRTGDGSRLVQIALASVARQPFYAAASNVLLPPTDAAAAPADPGLSVADPLAPAMWLGARAAGPGPA